MTFREDAAIHFRNLDDNRAQQTANPCDHAEHENAIKQASAALGHELFANLWAEARSASLDQLEV